MGRSRMLIILVVLCSGVLGRPAETIILEPASKLSQQPWSAKPGVPQSRDRPLDVPARKLTVCGRFKQIQAHACAGAA